MEKKVDLKYCPFCGGRAVEVLAEGKYFFECTICESRGQKARTLEDAKKLWNDRVKPPDYHKNSQWNKHGGFFYCAKCGCCTQAVPLSATYAAKPEAIAAWNRRAGVAPNKAKWEICCDSYYPYCSNCHKEPQGREMTKYCPNCGAEMCNPFLRKK